MKWVFAACGLSLGVLWLFQLNTNVREILLQWPYPPDFLSLGIAFAACRLGVNAAVGFAFLSGLVCDLSFDQRFGLFAFRDALFVSLFQPSRKVFYFESTASVVCAVFVFALARQLSSACLARGALLGAPVQFWLPRILGVCVMTALFGALTHGAFSLLMPKPEPESKRRRKC